MRCPAKGGSELYRFKSARISSALTDIQTGPRQLTAGQMG
jgi:hypothetical protein